nr:hypothetical protein [Lautropia mirabilis]
MSKRNQFTMGAALLALLAGCGGGDGADAGMSTSSTKAVEGRSAQLAAFTGEAAEAATLAAVVKAAGGTDADAAELQANVERAAGQELQAFVPGQTEVSVAPASAHAVKAVSPYSVSGVSGALLSAMLDQRVGNRLDEIGPTDRTMLVPVTARNAGQVNDAALPFVTAGYSLTPDNYVDGQYRAASSRQQLQMYMRVQNLGRASAQATTPFGEFNMNTAVSTDENSVSVGGMLHVLSWTPEKRANGTFSRAGVPGVTVLPGDSRIAFHQSNLYAPIGFVARKDQLVPYGSMIQQWSAENTYVQLWLLKNGSSSQPQLCWNFWLPKLKRTYCQAWQVPAGWIAGSVLQNGGNFVNDNREPQGGSGNLYWQQLSAAQ